MGKLTAILAGSALLLTFSYYVLSSSFSPLINWLGPLLGFRLDLLFGLWWLEQGTPLQYASIFAAWAAVGLIIGLTSKRYRTVLGTAVSLWVVIGVVALISVIAIVVSILTSASKGVLSSGIVSIANIPPGSNLFSIANEPVISRYLGYIPTLFTGGGLSSAISDFTRRNYFGAAEGFGSIILFFILGPLEALIIVLTVGIVTVYSKKRFLGPKVERGGKGEKGAEKAIIILLVCALILSSVASAGERESFGQEFGNGISQNAVIHELSSISSILGSLTRSPAGNMTASAYSPLSYAEGGLKSGDFRGHWSGYPSPSFALSNSSISGNVALSLITTKGDLLNAYGMVNVSNSSSNFPSPPSFSAAEFGIVVLQDNLEGMVQSLLNTSYLQPSNGSISTPFSNVSPTYDELVNLVPGFLYITVYNGSLSSTEPMASASASFLASDLGVKLWGRLIDFNTQNLQNATSSLSNVKSSTSEGPGVSLYVYAGVPSFRRSSSGFSSSILPQMFSGPVESLLQRSLNSGYLVPGDSSNSSNSSIIIAGFIHTGLFSQLLKGTSGSSLSSIAKTGSFALDLSLWQGRFHSSGTHMINAGSLFSFGGPLNTNSSVLTVIGYGSGLGTNTNTASIRDLNITLYSTDTALVNDSIGNETSSSNIKVYQMPQPFYLSNYGTKVNASFPANLTVNITSNESGGGEIVLHFSVMNHDQLSVSGAELSLHNFLSDYGSTLSVPSGTPEAIYLGSIAPGQEITFNYPFTPHGTGEYYIPPLTINYNYSGEHYSSQYGTGYWIEIGKPSVAYAVSSSVTSLLKLYPPLSPFASFHAGPLNIVELVILILIISDALIEFRAFARWRRERRGNKPEEEVKMEQPPQPPVQPPDPPKQS